MENISEVDGITVDTTVSTKELAIVLGLTTRRVQQLAQDGTFDAAERGRFPLTKSVKRYMDTFSKKESEFEKQRDAADITIKKSKAIVLALEAKELQGKMHRSEDVAAMTEDLVYTIRSMLVALPGRLAVDAVRAKTAAEASEIFRKEIHTIMSELSNYRYDPKKYEERVRERRSWDSLDGHDDDDE